MNQSAKSQRPVAIAFVLGALLTLFMGLMVLRMETAMLETGRTGFEGVGGLLMLSVTLLAALVAAAVVWAAVARESDAELSAVVRQTMRRLLLQLAMEVRPGLEAVAEYAQHTATACAACLGGLVGRLRGAPEDGPLYG